jgi:hypothetical protein
LDSNVLEMKYKSDSQLFRTAKVACLIMMLMVLLTHCINQDSKHGREVPKLFLEKDINNSGEVHLISEIADTAYYFKPSSDENNFIDEIIKVEKSDCLYIIQDKTHNLFVYNHSGKFKGFIGNAGRGPDEYLEITDFALNPSIDEIAVLDGSGREIFFYNSNGKLINKIKAEHHESQIRYLDSCTIITYTNRVVEYMNNHLLFNVIKTNGELIKRLHNVEKEEIPINSPVLTFNVIKNYYDTIHYFDNVNNKLYHLKSDTLLPILYLDFGEFNMPKKYLLPEKYPSQEDFKSMNNYLSINWFLETDDYFFFNAFLHKRLKLFVMDKASYRIQIPNITWRSPYQGYLNDLGGGGIFWPKGSFKNGELYSIIDPYQMADMLKLSVFIGYGIDTKDLEKELVNLHESSNPLILIVRLKNSKNRT